VIDNVDSWFMWWIVALAVATCIGYKFGKGIKPYDEGPPRTPGADYTGHIRCAVTNCNNPANGLHRTERIYMCDRCAQEFDALRKERHRRNSA